MIDNAKLIERLNIVVFQSQAIISAIYLLFLWPNQNPVKPKF